MDTGYQPTLNLITYAKIHDLIFVVDYYSGIDSEIFDWMVNLNILMLNHNVLIPIYIQFSETEFDDIELFELAEDFSKINSSIEFYPLNYNGIQICNGSSMYH